MMLKDIVRRELNYTHFLVEMGERTQSELDTLKECVKRLDDIHFVPSIAEVVGNLIGDWRGELTKDAVYEVMSSSISWYAHRKKLEELNERLFRLANPRGYTIHEIIEMLITDYYPDGVGESKKKFKLRFYHAALWVRSEQSAHFHTEVLRLGGRG